MTKDASGIAVQPVVMAGGSGTRLWPLSRAGYPKQFLVLDDSNRSLLQQAVQRLVEIADDDLLVAAPLVVGNEEHRFLILDQLREIQRDPAAVLLDEYLPFFLLLAFSEAWLGGMATTLMVVFRPEWVTTFDDRRYLTRRAGRSAVAERHRQDTGEKQE